MHHEQPIFIFRFQSQTSRIFRSGRKGHIAPECTEEISTLDESDALLTDMTKRDLETLLALDHISQKDYEYLLPTVVSDDDVDDDDEDG